MTLLEKAIQLAFISHYGRTDKAGKPYIFHLLRVMLAVEGLGEETMIVGVLHDLMEDTGCSLTCLSLRGFSDQVIKGLDAISHRDNESAEDYLGRIKANALAKEVKKADLADNMNEQRLALLDQDTAQRLRMKYTKALALLSGQPYCPCCYGSDVTLEQNEIARWVQCHNPRCGLTTHAATDPEVEQFFSATDVPRATKDV